MSRNKPIPNPLVDNIKSKDAATNTRILNTIRKAAPLDYRNRVPIATQGNIADVFAALDSYRPDWNVFWENLNNAFIVDLFRINDFTNPLGKYKMASVQTNGTMVRELGFNLIKARNYDKHATDVWDVSEPELHVNYHIQNRKDLYPMSLSEDIIKQAAMESETGIATTMNQSMSLPYTSAEEDEYLIMRQLFTEADQANPFYNVHIPDITQGTPEERRNTGSIIAQKIRQMYLTFKFLNTEFNAEGLPAKCDNPTLFATPEFLSNWQTMALAPTYHLEQLDFVGEVQVVDQFTLDNMGNHNAGAVLADPNIFIAADTKVKGVNIYNPKNDITNYFLHRWGVYSMSKFVNCVLFSARPDSRESILAHPTVEKVTIEIAPSKVGEVAPEFATPGTMTQLAATVSGSGDPSQAVNWQIVGDSGDIKSTNTYMTSTGQLWVGTDEPNSWLLIQAVSIADRSKSAQIRVGIGDKAPVQDEVTGVTITGAETVKPGSTHQYKADVAGDASNNVTWMLTGAPDGNTSISTVGKLKVNAGVPDGTELNVIAISRLKPSVNAAYKVTVKADASTKTDDDGDNANQS